MENVLNFETKSYGRSNKEFLLLEFKNILKNSREIDILTDAFLKYQYDKHICSVKAVVCVDRLIDILSDHRFTKDLTSKKHCISLVNNLKKIRKELD